MKKDLHIQLPQDLVDRIERYRKNQKPPPSRNALIAWLLEQALKRVHAP